MASDPVNKRQRSGSALLEAIQLHNAATVRTAHCTIRCPQAICAITSSIDALERLFLSVKQANADDLNDFSLESFYERCVEFTVCLILLLRSSLPWYNALVAHPLARGLAVLLWLGRLCVSAGDIRTVISQSIPGPMFLSATVIFSSCLSGLACVPAAFLGFIALLPDVKSASGSEHIILASVAVAGAAELLLTLAMACKAAKGVYAAYGLEQSRRTDTARLSGMAAGAWRVLRRILLTRPYALHSAVTSALLLALLTWPGKTWLLVFRVWLWFSIAILIAAAFCACLCWLRARWRYKRAWKCETELRHAESVGADQGGTALRPAPVLRQDELQLTAEGKTAALLFMQSFTASLMSIIAGLFVSQVQTALAPFAEPGLSLSSVIPAVGRMQDRIAVSGTWELNANVAILGCWLLCQVCGMSCLILLARALQRSWDADDEAADVRVLSSESQQTAAEGARKSAGGGNGAPLLLQKVGDGVYRRRAEDAQAHAIGTQIVDNPLHHLRTVAKAVSRRADHLEHARFHVVQPNTAAQAPPAVLLGAVPSEFTGLALPVPSDSQFQIVNPMRGQQERERVEGESDLDTTIASLHVAIHATGVGLDASSGSTVPGTSSSISAKRKGPVLFVETPMAVESALVSTETPVNGRAQHAVSPSATAMPRQLHTPAIARVAQSLQGTLSPRWSVSMPSHSPHAAVAAAVIRLASMSGIVVQRSASTQFMSVHTHGNGESAGDIRSPARRAGLSGSSSPRTPVGRTCRPPCFVCFDAEANCVLMECGHGGTCLSCALTIVRGPLTVGGVNEDGGHMTRGGGTGLCPVCRAPVMQVLQIGPDTTALDGSTVAVVLPGMYFRSHTDQLTVSAGSSTGP